MVCEVEGPAAEDDEGFGSGYGPGSKGICLPQSKELFQHMLDGASIRTPCCGFLK